MESNYDLRYPIPPIYHSITATKIIQWSLCQINSADVYTSLLFLLLCTRLMKPVEFQIIQSPSIVALHQLACIGWTSHSIHSPASICLFCNPWLHSSARTCFCLWYSYYRLQSPIGSLLHHSKDPGLLFCWLKWPDWKAIWLHSGNRSLFWIGPSRCNWDSTLCSPYRSSCIGYPRHSASLSNSSCYRSQPMIYADRNEGINNSLDSCSKS